MASPYEEALAEAVATGRYDAHQLARMKQRHDRDKALEDAAKAVEKEIAAARKKKANQDAERIAAAREEITPLLAELEEQRKTVTGTRDTLNAAQKAHNTALAEAQGTFRKIFDIAWDLWPGDTLPRDDYGNPTADIHTQQGVVVIDGATISALSTETAT